MEHSSRVLSAAVDTPLVYDDEKPLASAHAATVVTAAATVPLRNR